MDANIASGTAPLVEYRVYALDDRARILYPAGFVDALNDEMAIEIAARLADGHAIEIWQRTRLVARLKANTSHP